MLMKKFSPWYSTAIFLMSGMMLLTSCSDSDDKDNSDTTNPSDNTWVEPTTDQMGVRVTVDVPAVSLSQFEEKSVGAALIKRLPKVSSAITDDTELVLLRGSDVAGQSDAVMAQVANVLALGGYVALERPTETQLDNFMDKIEAALGNVVEQTVTDLFEEVAPEQMAATVKSSMAGRMAMRKANLASSSRAASADEVCAELIIFGSEDNYFENPIDETVQVTTYYTDSEGNILEDKGSETIHLGEVTAYQYGLIADGAAQWINDIEAQYDEEDAWYQVDGASRRVSRRAGGMAAINDLMNATETFTRTFQVYFRTYDASVMESKTNLMWFHRVAMTLRTWGVHNIETNKDFYYVNQNVLLRMGNGDGYDPFLTRYFSPRDWMQEVDKDKKKTGNRWYGNFLTQYVTSMDLQTADTKAAGVIACLAATPETANQVVTQSVNTTQSTTSSNTLTHSFTATIGMTGGSFEIRGNYKFNGQFTKTQGNSFAMTNSKTIKDLDVVKNTLGTQVTWSYNGKRPKTSGPGNVIHDQPADILVNDANLVNDACWSVESPSGQYKVQVGNLPVTGVLLLDSKGKSSIQETKTAFDNIWNVTLAQPCRSLQNWRMFVRVLEWKDGFKEGAQSDLQQALMKKFPDLYQSTIQIGELTPESVKNATAYILYSQKVFDVYKDILQGIAKSFGIKKFRITWSGDKNLETKKGYEVTVE